MTPTLATALPDEHGVDPQPIIVDPSHKGAGSKLPALVFSFWVMKICATTLGETAGDLLSMTMKIGYAASTVILLSAFVVTLVCQLRATRHRPFLYWLVILSTSTAGTTMSDFMNRTLGLGYATGSAILIGLLIAVLLVWRLTERTITVTDVRSLRAEVFYWAAILVSNTLGTSLGDYLADDSGLGFAGGAGVIAGVIGLVTLGYFFTSISRTGLFWAAFVLTRPLGATMGDFMTKAPQEGGVGIGTIGSSLVLAVLLVATIVFTTRRRPVKPTPPPRRAAREQ